MFRASTTWAVGDGLSCRSWTDHWINGWTAAEIAPLVYDLVPHRRRKIRLVHDGMHNRAWVQDIQGALGPLALLQYVELWRQVRLIHLTNSPDVICWRWTDSGQYSAKSCYEQMFAGSIRDPHWRPIWKS